MSNKTQPYRSIQDKRVHEEEYPSRITRAYHRREGKFIPIGYRVVWSDGLVTIYLDSDL